MPTLNTATRIATAPLPRILPPKGHAVIDYLTTGIFLASAAWFWNKNRRAALAALLCGGAELAVNLMTDYRGDARKSISLGVHRHVDFGLAALTALMPELLWFKDASEKRFFVMQGALMTAANQVTRFPTSPRRDELARRRRAA
jgi:hypothetical protein